MDPSQCFIAETAQVQLIHQNTPSYFGKVKHFFNNTWHTVCDENWTDLMSNSHVLCKQLGLGHALEHWLDYPDGANTSFLHTHMNCNGTENADRLTLCNHNFTMDKNCSGKSVPGIRCSGEYVLVGFGVNVLRRCAVFACGTIVQWAINRESTVYSIQWYEVMGSMQLTVTCNEDNYSS